MRIEVLKGSIESEIKAREQPTFGIAEKIAEPSVKLILSRHIWVACQTFQSLAIHCQNQHITIVELFAKVRPNQIFGQSLARTYSSSIVNSWEHVLVDK